VIVSIRFPDGRRRKYRVELRRGMTVEDIAEEIAAEMLREYRAKRTVKNPEGFINAHKRWLIAKLYSTIVEKLDLPIG